MPILPQSFYATLLTAIAGSGAPTAASAVWPTIAIGASGLCSWLYMMLTRAKQENESIQERRAVLERLHEARDKHLAGEMDGVKTTLRENKLELAAQRKKNHAAQEALRAAQQALREEVKRREAAQNERPAFAEIKPRAEAKAVPKPAPKAPVESAPTAPEPAASAESLALQAELETLKRRHGALVDALDKAKQACQTQKQNAQRLQRRHEDLRRIDIISRSKVELLEDKLRGMGRQYYEAISELALLKGEVAPPKPKGLPEAPPMFNGESMTPEMIEPTAETLRPVSLMAEGEDEDEQDEDHDSADAPTILDDLDSEGESDDSLPVPVDFSSPAQPQA